MKIIQFAILSLLAVVWFTTPAAAYVTDWTYSLDYGFISYTFDEGSSSAVPISEDDPVTLGGQPANRRLTWGNAVNNDPVTGDPLRSSLWFEQKNGLVSTNGAPVVVENIFHQNYPIWSNSDILTGGTVISELTLTPFLPGVGTPQSHTTTIGFSFWETSNGGIHPNDIFLVTAFGDSLFDFLYDGTEYTVSFLASFHELSGDTLSYLGLPTTDPGTGENLTYYGWTTEEGEITPIDTIFQITASPVPEPSTFILLAGGLLGLLVVSRNRFITK